MMRIACFVGAVLIGVAAHAETERFTGTAYDLKTGQVVYVEQYDVRLQDGRWAAGTTRYLSPAGQQIAERTFDFSRDRYVPLLSTIQTSVDYREGISRIDDKQVDVFLVRNGKREAKTLERVRNMVADCGSQVFVADNLDALASGATLQFTLAVPGRTDSFKLRARKVGEVDVGGRRALRIRIELDSVLRLVLPPLELTVDPESKRLLEYSGITNIKDPATKKAYSVRIAFTYQ